MSLTLSLKRDACHLSYTFSIQQCNKAIKMICLRTLSASFKSAMISPNCMHEHTLHVYLVWAWQTRFHPQNKTVFRFLRWHSSSVPTLEELLCVLPYKTQFLRQFHDCWCVKAVSNCVAKTGLVHSMTLLYSWIFCLMWESLFFRYSHLSLFSKYVGS